MQRYGSNGGRHGMTEEQKERAALEGLSRIKDMKQINNTLLLQQDMKPRLRLRLRLRYQGNKRTQGRVLNQRKTTTTTEQTTSGRSGDLTIKICVFIMDFRTEIFSKNVKHFQYFLPQLLTPNSNS